MSRPRVHESAAARQAAYRARKGQVVTVYIDAALKAELDAYIARQTMDGPPEMQTYSGVVEKLLRSQLLRKR